MNYATQYILKTFLCLMILTGALIATVALAHAAFVTPQTVLKVIQK